MTINPIALSLRARKLGVLIRNARQSSGRTIEECAQAIGIPSDQFEAWELGEKSPSMPEIERYAFFLNVPLAHFWGDQVLSHVGRALDHSNFDRVTGLRHRMIGAMLRKARLEASLSLEDLAEKAWSSPTLLESYEMGEVPIPLPDLEVFSGLLGRSLRDFQDRSGPVGAWEMQQQALQDFMALPPELQAFISRPINRPYIELAQKMSEMSVDKLRAVGEVLLEITL